ncbi:MAG: HutD/Ves family protein [Vulcanimicrobiaceae bacterium]
MRRIALAAYRRVPWKNGYGNSLDIAMATGSEPAWRISLASIERAGPFSDFTGYDRTIAIVKGSGCELRFDDGALVTLEPLEPYSFRGERVVRASLLDGPVEALNAMTRRAQCEHRVVAHYPGDPLLDARGALLSLFYILDADEAGDTVIDPSEAADWARLGINIVVDPLPDC